MTTISKTLYLEYLGPAADAIKYARIIDWYVLLRNDLDDLLRDHASHEGRNVV